MHRVAVLAYDTVVAAELAMVVQVFATANHCADAAFYEVGVAGAAGSVVTASVPGPSPAHIPSPAHVPSYTLGPDRSLAWAVPADTVVVPAHGSFLDPPPDAVRAALLTAHGRGARLASLCVGSFVLASTGVLDGRPATTHWYWADEFAVRFPAVDVQREKLFVGRDGVYTSAGITAALDLALNLVEQDLGAATAAATARFLVAPMRREGGQAQFIEYDVPGRADALSDTLRWAEEHLADDLSVADLSAHANMAPRTFTRHFRAGVGTTPVDWLLRTRVRRAKELLERTTWSIDRIAAETGFRSTVTFRHHFGRLVRVTPARYRRTFGSA
ncbi:GlxA family transcriptional regulator [Umezawaea sp.]|uniref:GlxA family transcriptional regulator n=1 Tax=Umezawaea sp. TaxID=1955258 RepID=UPI002ED637EB